MLPEPRPSLASRKPLWHSHTLGNRDWLFLLIQQRVWLLPLLPGLGLFQGVCLHCRSARGTLCLRAVAFRPRCKD